MGALGSPRIGEPFSINVAAVTFAGPDSWIIGAGSIVSSASSLNMSNSKNATIIATDAIPAPIAKYRALINNY